MEELRNVVIDVHPFSVEIPIEDFEYLIDAALFHNDEFFITLWEKLDEIKEKQYEQTAKS